MQDQEYLEASATALARLVGLRKVTAQEVTEAALRRIHLLDGRVRAFRDVFDDTAIARARAIDDSAATSNHARALLGVPVAVKGRASWQDRRLVAQGAVVIGATATPGAGTVWRTWGQTPRGATLNPYDPALVPGGSSAGAGVAVATGMVPLATGADGAGSIRIPAAWCGVLGLKCTNGLIPSRDRTGLAAGGALARHPEDLAAYLAAVTGRSEQAGTGAGRTSDGSAIGRATWQGGLRVTWSADLGFAATEPAIAAIARTALDRLITGTGLSEVALPVELLDPAPVWTALRSRDPDGRATTRTDESDTVQGEPSVRTAGRNGQNDERLRWIFRQTDFIATPTTPNSPHGHDGPGDAMSVALTWAFNLSGHPAISFPAGFTSAGAPVGLQLVGRHRLDGLLVAVAQRANIRVPPISPR